MKKLILKILLYFRLQNLKRKISFSGDCIFHINSRVGLHWGSMPTDIQLGKRVIMQGTLISGNGGKIIMGNYSQLGVNSKILSANKVVVGDYTAIAMDVIVCDNNNHPINPYDRMILRKTLPNSPERSWKYADSAPIIIGKNCWIGQCSRICKGVTIGDGSIIAANSVVTKDVPANCIVAGNPAKVVKTDIDITTKRYFEDRM